MKALSILQPWAWAVVHGHKPVENRGLGFAGIRYRGDLLVHAGKGLDMDGIAFIRARFPDVAATMPAATEFQRGGIVGRVRLVEIVRWDPSPWFGGPVGLLLADAQALPFRACRGQLGLFDVPDISADTPIAEKVAHVMAAPHVAGHTCHWPGCTTEVRPAVWGCKRHWSLLPRSLQRLIWSAYRPGQEQDKRPSLEYINAARAVQDWIAQREARRTAQGSLL